MSSKNWYILYVDPTKEEDIINNLVKLIKDEKLEIFYAKSISERKPYKILRGYIALFCIMSTDLFNKLIVLKGARKFLNHDKENHKLPFPFLDFNFYNIFNVNRDSFFIRKKNKNKFYIGDGIRIKDGFFKDLEGVIANVTGNKVQKLHIKSLVSNAETLIKIDSFLCEKINSKS